MKYLIMVLLLAGSAGIAEASFNRLWVGHKKKDITAAHFLNGLNATFFRDTINVGKGKGLDSYQPYITSMGADVPDELALVIYESEEKYRAIRSTPEGERYSAAHWDYFAKDESRSTVSVPFTGSLATGGAYELRPDYKSWQKSETIVSIYQIEESEHKDLPTAFAARKTEAGVRNAILLVGSSILIEYASVAKANVRLKPLGTIIERKHLPRKKLAELTNPVGTSEGVNFSF